MSKTYRHTTARNVRQGAFKRMVSTARRLDPESSEGWTETLHAQRSHKAVQRRLAEQGVLR